MRRLYGEMDSPTLYREMRSTADKSSNNFHSSKHDGRNTKKTTKVIMNHYVIYSITMRIFFHTLYEPFNLLVNIISHSQNKVVVVQFSFHILLDHLMELRHYSLPLITILELALA